MASPLDRAGRTIAGLLGYDPGPGIYSRLERAVQGMPANVRVEEIPGLLKRYKDGVPGWELKAADLDSVIAGRSVVPRDELLSAVRERSPVYTHREVVLGGRPQQEGVLRYKVLGPDDDGFGLQEQVAGFEPDYQSSPSPVGRGVSHGEAAFERWGQGGENYGELVILSPEARRGGWGQNVHHFHKDYPQMRAATGPMSPEVRSGLTNEGVAHARFDEHDGALRVNEVQSDLGIHNRKVREGGLSPRQQLPSESDSDYAEAMTEAGYSVHWEDDGNVVALPKPEVPFPMEDVSMELLAKRLALYAAQNNLRRIEIASPQSIIDSLNMDPDRARHVYDKLLPGHLERLGRKMGGMTPVATKRGPEPVTGSPYDITAAEAKVRDQFADLSAEANQYMKPDSKLLKSDGLIRRLEQAVRSGEDAVPHAERLKLNMLIHASDSGWPAEAAEIAVDRTMPGIMRRVENYAHARNQRNAIAQLSAETEPAFSPPAEPGRAYEMSEEMFRRILTQGIGASLLAPMAMEE
jgi:hypothetical protein